MTQFLKFLNRESRDIRNNGQLNSMTEHCPGVFKALFCSSFFTSFRTAFFQSSFTHIKYFFFGYHIIQVS